MSKQKQRITRTLRRRGMAWAVRSDKYIDPSDPFGARRTYHIHPNRRYPHQNAIRRFGSLSSLEDWLRHGDEW